MVAFGGKIRQDLVFEHRPHFTRRSGHEDKRLFAVGHGKSVGGAEAVFENMRALRKKRLFAVVIGHHASARCKIGLQAFENFRMLDKRQAEKLGGHLFGDIVIGRAKAAGDEHKIAPGERKLHTFGHARRIIAADRVIIDVKTGFRKAFAEIGGVGVDNVADKHLCADTQNFCVHALSSTTLSMLAKARSQRPSTSSFASSFNTFSKIGLVTGWRGVNTVQQSS